MDFLDTISNWNDGDISSQANSLRHSILQGEFIISRFVLSKIFAIYWTTIVETIKMR